MVAIQPGLVDWGEAPTPAVAAAIPPACTAIRQLIEEWQHGA
jgi:hydrogenase maturation protease